jgi:hypothetical protein
MTFDHDEIERIAQCMEQEFGSHAALRMILRDALRHSGKLSAGFVRAGPPEAPRPWEPKPQPPAVLLRSED